MRKVLVRRLSARAGLAVLAGGLLGGVVTAIPAAAAGPSCSVSGARVTCVYSTVGSDTFTVPEGVSQVTVDALGAQGGAATDGTAGGYGGEATAAIGVSGGQILQVNVGGEPARGNPAAGGFNGGGTGGASRSGRGGGGGGGASDVRQSGTALFNRVVIAGGGGGGGGTPPGSPACVGGTGGGISGGDAFRGQDCNSGISAGSGGTQTGGGAGGSLGGPAQIVPGASGTSGSGGSGGSATGFPAGTGGGGGGGGLFGGGGGGGADGQASGGGGGGSGLVPSGGTMTNGARAGDGQVTISYTLLPPQISEAFGPSPVPFGGSTSLTYTITNPNPGAQLTGVGFTGTLPSPGLVVATPDSGLSGSGCGGTITAVPDSAAVTLSGATLGASESCTFSVNVTGTRPGVYTATAGPVTFNNGGTGGTATADVTVAGCPAATPDARLLTAATNAGTIIGGFCVNALGTGTYHQGTAGGTGVAEDVLGVTTVTAVGTGLDLIGTGAGSLSTFRERAPVSAAGTYTLG